ncbi:hypothetical protein [Chitinimonas sp. JJ19]|uniref:hypothetical protein n=1 Tax=Chitinimonas sp. JJ19 TaxID=3109352 RepID=UPI003001BED3
MVSPIAGPSASRPPAALPAQHHGFAGELAGQLATQASRLGSLNPPDPAQAAADLTATLPAKLRQYGIRVPPDLRMEAGAQGILLRDDPRAAAFHAMLAAEPQLANQISQVLSGAEVTRAGAFAAAAQHFTDNAKDPRHAKAVVERYRRDHPAPPLSVSYNGFKVETAERGPEGWRPVKTEAEFAWELAEAAQRYAKDEETLFNSLMAAVSSKASTSATAADQASEETMDPDSSNLVPIESSSAATP